MARPTPTRRAALADCARALHPPQEVSPGREAEKCLQMATSLEASEYAFAGMCSRKPPAETSSQTLFPCKSLEPTPGLEPGTPSLRALISCRRSTPRVVRSRSNPRNPPGRGGGRRPQTTAAQTPHRPAGGINTNWLVIGASPSRRRSMTQPQGRRVLHRGCSRRRTWARVLPANRGARASRRAD